MPNWHRYAKRQARHSAGVHYEGMRRSRRRSGNGASGSAAPIITLNEWWKEAPNGRKCASCANSGKCTRNRAGNHAGCWERVLTEEEHERKEKESREWKQEVMRAEEVRKLKKQEEAKFGYLVMLVLALIIVAIYSIVDARIAAKNHELDAINLAWREMHAAPTPTKVPDFAFDSSVSEYCPSFPDDFSNACPWTYKYTYMACYWKDENRLHITVSLKDDYLFDVGEASVDDYSVFREQAVSVANVAFRCLYRNELRCNISVALKYVVGGMGWTSYRWTSTDFNGVFVTTDGSLK